MPLEIQQADSGAFGGGNKTKLKPSGDIEPLYPYAFYPGHSVAERPRDPLLTKSPSTIKISEDEQKDKKNFLSFLLPNKQSKSSTPTKPKKTSLFSFKTSKAGNALIVLMSTYPTALAITQNLRRDDILSLFTALKSHLYISLRGKPQFTRWLRTMVRNTTECVTCGIKADESTALEAMREYRLKGWYKGTHTCVGCGDIICTACATFFAHSEDWKETFAHNLGFSKRYVKVNGYRIRRYGAEETITMVRSFCGSCARNPCSYNKVGFGHEAQPNLVVVEVKTGRETSSSVAINDGANSTSSRRGSEEGTRERSLDRRTVMVEECNVVPYGFFKLATTPCWMIEPGGAVMEGHDFGFGQVVIRTRVR